MSEGDRQSLCQRQLSRATTLRHCHMPQPFGTLDCQAPSGQVDVSPRERDDLPEPQSRITTQQHHQLRLRIPFPRHRQQPLVLIEVLEPFVFFELGNN